MRTNQKLFKYLRYVIHAIWCSKIPKVVGVLFFILRMALIFRMINPLIHKSSLLDSVKKDIKNQVRQVITYYLGQYVELINELDGGIRSREVVKRKGTKKLDNESDDFDMVEKEDVDEEDTGIKYTSPSTKTPSSTKSYETNKVEIDISKATPAQAKYVNNLLNAQKKRG